MLQQVKVSSENVIFEWNSLHLEFIPNVGFHVQYHKGFCQILIKFHALQVRRDVNKMSYSTVFQGLNLLLGKFPFEVAYQDRLSVLDTFQYGFFKVFLFVDLHFQVRVSLLQISLRQNVWIKEENWFISIQQCNHSIFNFGIIFKERALDSEELWADKPVCGDHLIESEVVWVKPKLSLQSFKVGSLEVFIEQISKCVHCAEVTT